MNKAKATLYNLRIAPRKVRLVSDLLKGKSVNDSMARLQLMLKRFLPRAQGRATPIQKKMSHLSVTLGEKDALTSKYTIYEFKREKKSKVDHSGHDHAKPKADTVKKVGDESKPGYFKKMFQRKSI